MAPKKWTEAQITRFSHSKLKQVCDDWGVQTPSHELVSELRARLARKIHESCQQSNAKPEAAELQPLPGVVSISLVFLYLGLVRVSFGLVPGLVRALPGPVDPDLPPLPLPPPVAAPPATTSSSETTTLCVSCSCALLQTSNLLLHNCWQEQEQLHDKVRPADAITSADSRDGVASQDQCAECNAILAEENNSPLRGFCRTCFDRNIARIVAEAPELTSLANAAEDFSARGAAADVKNRAPPENGWQRMPRESQQIWFARIQKHLDGDASKKQKEYLAAWRNMTEAEQHTWAQGILSDQAQDKTGPAEVLAPEARSPEELVREFADISANASVRAKNPEKRWEMYLQAARLVQIGQYKSVHAASSCPELKALSIDRHKLQSALDLMSTDGIGPPCPPSFRTGRAAQTQLTAIEKEDLLSYIRFHAKHAMPLSVVEIEPLGKCDFFPSS